MLNLTAQSAPKGEMLGIGTAGLDAVLGYLVVFIGLILLSGTFMAIGLLCATFSKSQIVCFILGALACFILYWTILQDHYSSLSRGVMDLRDVLFFIALAVLAVTAAIFTIDKLTRQ